MCVCIYVCVCVCLLIFGGHGWWTYICLPLEVMGGGYIPFIRGDGRWVHAFH